MFLALNFSGDHVDCFSIFSFSRRTMGSCRSKPTSLDIHCASCHVELKERRWRCWDCDISLCENCAAKDEPSNPHSYALELFCKVECVDSGHLVGKDRVGSIEPARGKLIRLECACLLSSRSAEKRFEMAFRNTALDRFSAFARTSSVNSMFRLPFHSCVRSANRVQLSALSLAVSLAFIRLRAQTR